jgi:hypothetical protein
VCTSADQKVFRALFRRRNRTKPEAVISISLSDFKQVLHLTTMNGCDGLLSQCVNKELMTPGEHESGSIADSICPPLVADANLRKTYSPT